MSWCQFKFAYLLDEPGLMPLINDILDEALFQRMGKAKLPDGWDFVGSDISGAAGFVLLFETYHPPPVWEMEEVRAELHRLCKEEETNET